MSDQPKQDFLDRSGWWPCGCFRGSVKRGTRQFKLNAPAVAKCRRCGTTKAEHDEMARRMRHE